VLSDRERLAKYQAELLDALHQDLPLEEQRALVQRIAKRYEQPTSNLDSRMVEVAAELTKKWGVRR